MPWSSARFCQSMGVIVCLSFSQREVGSNVGTPTPEERGIVIAGGGLKYFPSVWVCVHRVRHFGCQLRIQLWYLGDGECDPYMRRLLKPLGVVWPRSTGCAPIGTASTW